MRVFEQARPSAQYELLWRIICAEKVGCKKVCNLTNNRIIAGDEVPSAANDVPAGSFHEVGVGLDEDCTEVKQFNMEHVIRVGHAVLNN